MVTIKSAAARSVIKKAVPFVLIPAVVLVSGLLLREKHYALVCLLISVLALLLFISGYEKKKVGSRRMILTAIMTALSAVGRLIPVIKPVTAFTILSGMYLGPEAGFLTGALSALISNFYFGHGPWTPFQMFAWGFIGLLSGYMAKPLKKSRALLLGFGFLSGALFSAVMDVWTVLWYGEGFRIETYLAALYTAIPFTLIYGASNVLFLLILARPFGQKLERINVKYGI